MTKTDNEIELDIEFMGRRGDGVGHYQDVPVFVARALPGERVTVSLQERQNGWGGQIEKTLSQSPDRVTPPCPYYETCGSCSLQHWAEAPYRQWKQERVKRALAKVGVEPVCWEEPVFLGSGLRRRASWAAFKQHKELRLGYHRQRSHDIIDIPSCLVVSKKIQQAADQMRPYLFKLLTDSRPADIFVQDSGKALDVMITGPVGKNHTPRAAEKEIMADMAEACHLARVSWRAKDRDRPQVMVDNEPVIKRVGPLKIELPPAAFLQPSEEGEKALVKAVMAAFPKGFKGRVADLFAGCGTFTGPLLKRYRVHAVEGDGEAVEALNAAAAGRIDLKLARRDLFTSPLSTDELRPFSAVVFDPPRAGAREQAEYLARSAVPLVIGVSCNPSTFARDAALLAQGGYKLQSLQVIDQFIWSSHIELVGVFRR